MEIREDDWEVGEGNLSLPVLDGGVESGVDRKEDSKGGSDERKKEEEEEEKDDEQKVSPRVTQGSWVYGGHRPSGPPVRIQTETVIPKFVLFWHGPEPPPRFRCNRPNG